MALYRQAVEVRVEGLKRKPSFFEKMKAVKDFSTDGCTVAPDLDFRLCCVQHDWDYLTKNSKTTRPEADQRLRQCIQLQGYPVLAWVYWGAVRCVGWRFWRP